MESLNPTSSSQLSSMEVDRSEDNVNNVILPLGEEAREVADPGSSYPLVPMIPISFSEIEKDGKQYLLPHQPYEHHGLSEESVPAISHDYQYGIDGATGNLLLIQDSGFSNNTNTTLQLADITARSEMTSSCDIPFTGDALAMLQVLTNGHCVLETPAERLTFHSVEDIHSGDVGEMTQHYECGTKTENDEVSTPKRALWSRSEVIDFIQCIHNHEHRFRKCSKIKGNIWNIISKDMFELGYRDCNRDECGKKWNNLYRTWKKVKLRPKEDRSKWQYFDQMTNLMKSIFHRSKDKGSSKKSVKQSAQELVVRLMEQNCRHQQVIRAAEEKFQTEILRLNKERDDIIYDIQKKLQT